MFRKRFFNVKEAADYLRVSVPYIYYLLKNKTIPIYTKRKRFFLAKEDLDKFDNYIKRFKK